MASKNDPPPASADREIVISRVFRAPRELVWQAWTDPRQVVRWWGPTGFTTTIEEMNVRPGGVWRHVMHGPDGADYPNRSVFTAVVKPERIVYTHGGARKGGPGARFEATWTFDALGDETRVTIRMVFPSASARDQVVREYGAIEGGKQTLARLAGHLAGVPVIVERTFHAPIAVVWRAITDPAQMKQWYFEDLDSFRPKVGFQTQFNVRKGDKNFLHLWQVSDVVPGRKIAYRWKFGGYPGESLVTFALSAEGDKTKLTLTHQGLETFQPETNPDLARGNFVQGWTHLVGSSLTGFVEMTAAATEPLFVISRIFAAPRELVWRAWTEPGRVAQWWGPHTFTNAVCELDVRPGGPYRIVMRSPEGVDYPIKGVFLEIVPLQRLVMTMDCSEHPDAWHELVDPHRRKGDNPAGKLVQTVTFEDLGGQTRLTVRTRFESFAIRDAMLKMGMTEGWSQSLDRLAGCLAKG